VSERKSDSRSLGFGTTLLVAVVLLVAAGFVVSLVPMAACPECEGGSVGVVTRIDKPDGDFDVAGCTTCDDKTKVPLLKKWTYRRD
jgi:hypothetical protein